MPFHGALDTTHVTMVTTPAQPKLRALVFWCAALCFGVQTWKTKHICSTNPLQPLLKCCICRFPHSPTNYVRLAFASVSIKVKSNKKKKHFLLWLTAAEAATPPSSQSAGVTAQRRPLLFTPNPLNESRRPLLPLPCQTNRQLSQIRRRHDKKGNYMSFPLPSSPSPARHRSPAILAALFVQ